MEYAVERFPPMTQQFQADFERVAQLRSQLADLLENATSTLQGADQEQPNRSGQLELSRHVQALDKVQQTLQQKTLRLLVLGDLKRGKSTLINALLGAPILPSDVTPCTAVLTVLQFGMTPQVEVHFKDDREPVWIDIEAFRENYTIDPEEAKRLDETQEQAFPEVSHAIVEYPLPLLEQGLEIIDSPGLNDTESRNQLVLEFMQDCHGVLFVFDATQPMTLDERRYLSNYLKGRHFPIFYVVNQWDRLQSNVLEGSIESAMERVRQVFRSSVEGDADLFEISALNVLRARYKDPEATIEPEFNRLMETLRRFVTQDRFLAEWQYAERTLRLVTQQVTESIQTRVMLLDETVQSLEAKLKDLQQEFEQLAQIRDQFQALIRSKRDGEVEAITQSFRTYILGLEDSFEADFVASQPDLDFLQFLKPGNREAFYTNFRRAFERYMNDRLAAWEFTAKQQISRAFEALNHESDEYRVAYSQVVETMNAKLLGDRFYAFRTQDDSKQPLLWIDAMKDLFGVIPQQLNNAVGGFNHFWTHVLEQALVTVCVVMAFQIIGIIFSSLALNVFAVALAGAGVMTVQAEFVRQEFLKRTHREFAKYLPQIANEQQVPLRQAVQRCF